MRYALLDLAACQQCHAALASFAARELPSEIPQAIQPSAARVAAGPGLGPAPSSAHDTPLAALLQQHGRAAGDPARNFAVEVEEGLLICPECGRWYPIIGQLPEILPDHLRNAERDLVFFRSVSAALPEEIRAQLERFIPAGNAAVDAGGHYKTAEMSIRSKINDPTFFGPGYSVPFNPWNPEFTLRLIALFGSVIRVLELRKGETLVDSGCGYGWSTEWMFKSGVNAIGVDICRTYLEIGVERMGAWRPHLVIGDVENLPLKAAVADAVLAYESFHHIPDRNRAMASYDRVLRTGGRVVLAEPGGDHEHAEVSVDAMQKFGILERGMELDDVVGYARGTGLTGVEELYLPRMGDTDRNELVSRTLLRTRSMDDNLFKLTKDGTLPDVRRRNIVQRRLWPAAKHRLKRAAVRLGLE